MFWPQNATSVRLALLVVSLPRVKGEVPAEQIEGSVIVGALLNPDGGAFPWLIAGAAEKIAGTTNRIAPPANRAEIFR
jgi:hypothetical protein